MSQLIFVVFLARLFSDDQQFLTYRTRRTMPMCLKVVVSNKFSLKIRIDGRCALKILSHLPLVALEKWHWSLFWIYWSAVNAVFQDWLFNKKLLQIDNRP